MNSNQRKEARIERDKEKREQRRQERSDTIGGIEDVFSYRKLFFAGKKCCNGYRWKHSVQLFELNLFSSTAVLYKELQDGTWEPDKYNHFTTIERGKTREIDAPTLRDRQVHKAITNGAVLPLYMPSIIKNNAASLKGRGLNYAWDHCRDDLMYHYRRYGVEGWVIILDYTGFFPNALHDVVYQRHEQYILNPSLREIANKIIGSAPGERGMPLGVELSQSEMVAYPSALDNYIKCQLGIKGMGHYMDDYYVLIPPDKNPKEILDLIVNKAAEIGLIINLTKTRITPLNHWFKFCKVKFLLTDTGGVVRCGNKKGISRALRKMHLFKERYDNGEMDFESIRESLQSTFAYYRQYDNHNNLLTLYRMFYAIFGFSFELVEKKSKGVNGVCSISSLEHFREHPLLEEHSRSQEELPVKP